MPATLSVVLGLGTVALAESLGSAYGLWAMAAAAPALILAAKWMLIGRYRSGEHPLWSFFVWRDEIINSMQEQLAGAWLLNKAMGTPLMGVYLRAMGARVGRGVWCETLTITEFDLVNLGDGCVVNRTSCVETHLFHDRLTRIGPATLGPGSTLGPSSVVLPDTCLGAGVTVAGRSVVRRGEGASSRHTLARRSRVRGSRRPRVTAKHINVVGGPRECIRDGDGGPQVRLLDAQAEGLDEAGLRRLAHMLTKEAGAGCVSRSHRYPYALVAWHSGPVGVDIERVEPVDEHFAASICTSTERLVLDPTDAARVTALWCGKEALARHWATRSPTTRKRLASPVDWPNRCAGPWRAAELPGPERHAAWLCWRAAA